MQLLGQGGRLKGESDREDDARGMARGCWRWWRRW